MHDSHIHLAMKPLSENWKRDIQDFLDLGGKKILTQGTDIEDFCETLNLAEEINKHFKLQIVDTAIGIHPTVFKENFNMEDLDQICDSTKKFIHRFQDIFEKEKSKLTAIGETGLDYFEMYNNGITNEKIEVFKEIQKVSFSSHILLAKDNNLPLSIHAREKENESYCIQDALEIVAKKGNGLVTGVFHSYTGSIEKLPNILDLGFGVGFNAIITYPSGESVREILNKTPLDRIFFETDGPFLPTQGVRRNKKALVRYGRSAQIREIMEVAAEIKNIPVEKLEIIANENYKRVFG